MMIDFAPIKTEYADVHMLNHSPFVGFKEAVVSPEECDYLITLATGKLKRAKVTLDEENDITPGRSGSNCWLRYAEDATVKKIGERIASLVGIPLENAEAMQIIHYGPEQEYRSHYDAYDLTSVRGQRCCVNGGQRLVTALVYLNDVVEGGGTRFAKLNTEIEAKQGRMALFNNVGEDYNYPHKDSLHAGTAVIEGEKWAFNIWFHARPMKEKQDFSLYPNMKQGTANTAPASQINPLESRDEGPQVRLKVNRASKIFQQVVDQLDPVLLHHAGPICFTHWDTYRNAPLDLSDVADGTRVFKLVGRVIVNSLSNKATLAKSLQEHQLEAIAPSTYFNIEDAINHQGEPTPIWFLKSVHGTGGKNMSCVANDALADTELQTNYIIQAGVTNLTLFDGRKFTCRAYCLIWDHKIYLYQNGFLVVHGQSYDPNSTDYAVQIDHTGYADKHSPVTMLPLLRYPEYDRYYPEIRKLIETLTPVLEPTRLAADSSHYIVLGIDMLFRADGSVRLLEINSIPNFVHSKEIIDKVNIPFFTAMLRTMLGEQTMVLEPINQP